MPYNVDLMLQVREQIVSEPKSHDQRDYENVNGSCGTTRCIAGWAIFFAHGANKSIYADEIRGADDDTQRWSSSHMGQELLGLSDWEADGLFYEMDADRALAKLDELIEKGKNQ